MNIMISGTYDNRSVAIFEIFGRENLLCITTNNHVFDPAKCLHTVYGFFHPDIRVDKVSNKQMKWTHSERNNKVIINGKEMTQKVYMMTSAVNMIMDFLTESTKNIIVFMSNKTLTYELYTSLQSRTGDLNGWYIGDVDSIHNSNDKQMSYLNDYFTKDPKRKKKTVMLTWFRSVFSEGIDLENHTTTAILIFGLPWANMNSKDIQAKHQFYMNTLGQKIHKTVENILYLSDMRNSVIQAIGRLARTSMSVGMILIND
jgi:Rad3-related DNA helicase